MTKKDYILLSTAIRSIDNDLFRINAARAIAYALREDNRRFDIDRFIKACWKETTDA